MLRKILLGLPSKNVSKVIHKKFQKRGSKMSYSSQVVTAKDEYEASNHLTIKEVIDKGLAYGVNFVAVAAVSLMVFTTLAISHIGPFQECLQCLVLR